MMKTIIRLPVLLVLNSFWTLPIVSQPKFSVPLIEHGICPFEFGCDFHRWYVRAPVTAYTIEGDTTSPNFHVAMAESLKFNYGDMYIERIGVVTIVKPKEGFDIGDTLYVLSYTGEGNFNIWHKGQFKNIEVFWGDNPADSGCAGKELVEVEMSWWANVTDSHNRTFWLRFIDCDYNDIEMRQIGFENYWSDRVCALTSGSS